jgi:glycosyltransferase involved in cell wall biosynthesis
MKLTIHATNVTGMGASEVVVSLLGAMESIESPYDKIDCHIPMDGPLVGYTAKSSKLNIIPFRRFVPKPFSRIIECLFPGLFFALGEHVIVLGDVPLRTHRKQIVFVHQAHLVYPWVNSRVGNTAIFRVMRALARLNASYADCVITQTGATASGLRRSYRDWASRDCVKVIHMPAPSWITPSVYESTLSQGPRGLRLFYPAAGYPHKNHRLLEGLFERDLSNVFERVVVTLPAGHFKFQPKWLSCVGQLNQPECLAEYRRADALIFLSVLESLGLPLIEAMVLGMPIIAADLPYARVICGGNAIYFDPDSSDAFVEACAELQRRLSDGWRPDWSSSLNTLPMSWDNVAQRFLEALV